MITSFKSGTKCYGKKIVDGKEHTVSTGKTTKAEVANVADYKLLTKIGIAPKTVHDRVQFPEKSQQKCGH